MCFDDKYSLHTNRNNGRQEKPDLYRVSAIYDRNARWLTDDTGRTVLKIEESP
ncbi:hypothetical protein CY34DRAFT_802347 [Suillus luteus UH-Slu-Lm8-n1]|uniref:Uncharacterized protein n=1 Tax=Suillus luteus UH-Slu-Lm8-n1 TaxID=930992 RepID=A0A0D0B4C0_9AGAM|nr:hypothetical protein CY34DRAFT_802347 [Suillus luteus UH-Slu-Lm8-n1]